MKVEVFHLLLHIFAPEEGHFAAPSAACQAATEGTIYGTGYDSTCAIHCENFVVAGQVCIPSNPTGNFTYDHMHRDENSQRL